jgi:hypothetical protein
MMNYEPETIIKIAEALIEAAEREKERADADVVNYLICSNSRQALSNFLIGFLLRENIEVKIPTSTASLLEQCQSIDARFELLNLAPMHCKFDTHDREYCLDHKHVGACLELAQMARSIVRSDSPSY